MLFSVSVCLHKKIISIEGKYGNLWKSNEFDKLQCLVSELFTSVSSTQDHQSICQMYNKAFCQEDSEHNLSLDGVSLDIYNDSDDESDDKQEIPDSQDDCKQAVKVNPLRKIGAKSKRKSLSARLLIHHLLIPNVIRGVVVLLNLIQMLTRKINPLKLFWMKSSPLKNEWLAWKK